MARIPDHYPDSLAFVTDLLEKTGIVVTPGQSFGKQGSRYIRIALVQDADKIKEAAERIKNLRFFKPSNKKWIIIDSSNCLNKKHNIWIKIRVLCFFFFDELNISI